MYSPTVNHERSPVSGLLFTVRVSGGGLKNHDSTRETTGSSTGSTLHCGVADTDVLIQPHTLRANLLTALKKRGLIGWHRPGLAVTIKLITAGSEHHTEAGEPSRVCPIRSTCAPALGQKRTPDSWQITGWSQHLRKDL